MSDEADLSDAKIADAIGDAIAHCRRAPVLPATGYCHNCGELLAGGARFCDTDCRDDWEKRANLPSPRSLSGVEGRG